MQPSDPILLDHIQDAVWVDPRWASEGGVTHCNQASLAVANGLGCHVFDPPSGGEPYTADQLFNFLQRSTSGFLEKNMPDVQAIADAGGLVFAVLPSWILGEQHGHIVSLTPGPMMFSPSLNKDVPLCLNISTPELSGRRVGLNWAFPMLKATPRFFAWKELLS